jgi:hypothetical protein
MSRDVAPAPKGRRYVLLYWPLLILLILHTVLQWRLLFIEYWNDELYTLSSFVFRPAFEIVTDYHAPNNHILFSLLMHGWTTCIGIKSLPQAIDHVHLARLCPFLLSALAITFTYRSAHRLAGSWAAIISATVLITTIPFYNYATQIRGYGLSMCMAAWLGSAMTDAYYAPKGKLGFAQIIVATAFCIYTLPSNLYFCISLFIALIAVWYILRRGSPLDTFKVIGNILLAVAIGGMLSILLYLPILRQVLHHYVSSPRKSNQLLLTSALPIIAYHFLSARYLLLLLILPVSLLLLKRQPKLAAIAMGVPIILFVLPFVFSDIRHSNAPHRIFLTPLPLIAIALGVVFCRSMTFIRHRVWQHLTGLAICLYCMVVCFLQVDKAQAKVASDIRDGQRSGDLYYQFNLHYFHPSNDARKYMRYYASPQVPLVEACRMDEEILKYLSMAGWDRSAASIQSLSTALSRYNTVDVLVESPVKLLDSLHTLRQSPKATILLPGLRQVQIVRLVK